MQAVSFYLTINLLAKRSTSGVATPGHTRACAHVKFACARVKIVYKAKVNNQLLACTIASFMWT